MKRSFRTYISQDSSFRTQLSEMAMGVSAAQTNFPITQPMANLLSLVPGVGLKAKAMNWLLSEGLLEASQGRERLLHIVNESLAKPNVVPMNPSQSFQNVQPTRKVSGMAEARELWSAQGEDPHSPESSEFQPVKANDLFSPEAWKRRPELARLRIEGDNIVDYYRKHFEPKVMVLDYAGGKYKRFNLDKMRAILKAHGLRQFWYGGFDGYMQFVEKGDYLPVEAKRSMYATNDQHGIDLRPEKRLDRTGQEVDVDDVQGVDAKGNPVINFMGGSVSPDIDRAEQLIAKMRGVFNNTMDAIQQGKNVGHLSPEEVDIYRQLLQTKKLLEKMEVDPKEAGAGKGGLAKKFNVPDYVRGSTKMPFPDTIEPMLFLQKVREGLDQPRKAKAGSWKNPEAFGDEWDGKGPEPTGGWYRLEGNQLIFKLNPRQQEEIMNYIVRDYQRTGTLNVRFDLNSKTAASTFPALAAAGPVGGTRIIVSQLFNAGLKSNPEDVAGMKMVMYRMQGIEPKHYVADQMFHPVEVNPFDPHDEKLTALKDRGYRWELNTPKERANGFPDLIDRKIAYLSLKGSRYRVQQDADNGKWYLFVPSNKEGEPFSPASHGLIGHAWLGAGDLSYGGGLGGKHLKVNPAGPKTWNQLKNMLMQGKLGEPGGPFSNEFELPSVEEGVNKAIQWFQKKTYPHAHKSFGMKQLYEWAVEGLRAFSGDPAFQVGYISQEEISNILKWDMSKQAKEEEDWGDGMGILPLMIRNNIEDPELQSGLIQHVLNQVGKQPIVDLDEFPPQVKRIFGENAFQARVREIGKYVLARMKKAIGEDKVGRKTIAQSALGGGDDEGRAPDLTGADPGSSGEGSYDSGMRQVMNPQDLLKLYGLHQPEKPQAPAPQTTFGGAMPLPKPDTLSVTANLPQQQPARQAPSKPQAGWAANLRTTHPAKLKPTVQQPDRSGLDQLFTPEPQTLDDLLGEMIDISGLEKLFENAHFFGSELERLLGVDGLLSYRQWRAIKEGDAVFDPKQKPHDGGGWNWWGEPGKPGGVSIAGDPIKPKGEKRGRKSKQH